MPTARPGGAPAPSPDELSAERRSRALEEPLDVRPRPGPPYAEFEVRNPRRRTRYRVLVPEFPSRTGAFCGCSDFGRRGVGTCKHLEAVGLWIAEHPGEGSPRPRPADGSARWEEIDRRIERAGADGGSDPRRSRRAGAVLAE